MIYFSIIDMHVCYSMGLVLHGACASSHSHGHSHHHNHHHSADESNRNINIRAAVIHVVGDLVQSVGVFISSIVIKFYVSFLSIDN
jgi:solute carrier family 30 (zinc transporter), member 2